MGGMGGMGGRGGMRGRQGGANRGPQKGSDLQCEVEFPFDVACFGGDRGVQVRREEVCENCTGKGTRKDAGKPQCRQCGGAGVAMQVMQTPFGVMQTQGVCPACGGNGLDPSCICPNCRGKGTAPVVKEVSVKVPAGCADGNQLRVRGEGDKGTRGAPPGDLYIAVKVQQSREFQREGFDIYTEISISIFDALLGTTDQVRTIDGQAEIKVPAGTQPETRMRIRGRGVPKLGKPNERGDHYITMKVEVPRTLNDKQKELVAELKELS
jgi:molecular chaperone DnaJ